MKGLNFFLELTFAAATAGNGVSQMQEPTVLRETKIGQKGFIKEDVMQYLDELNSKIISLETELQKASETGPADPQEIVKYRNQVDNLQEKLNASNNALRAAKAELDAAKKQHEQDVATINQLKAGGAAPAAGAQQAKGVNPAELNAAKAEIEKLKNQLKAAEDKAAAAQRAVEAAKAAPAPAPAAPVADTSAKDAEIAKAKAEITKVTGDLSAKEKELAAKTAEITEKDSKISQLTRDVKAKDDTIAAKDKEISKLNDEITELKENAEAGGMIPSSFDMGALFTEAQKTANKITIEARHAADKTTREANEQAEKIVSDATIEAQKTLDNANTTAAACINEANEQAKRTVLEANLHADKVNEMSATVRNLLANEIESINTKFNDISTAINRLTGQASDRMNEAQLIIGEARKVVDSNKDADVKKAEAPTASFEAKTVAAAPSKPEIKQPERPAYTAPAHQPAQTHAQPSKPYIPPHQENKAPKKAANFNFDMSELLKAAEEEAAKGTE